MPHLYKITFIIANVIYCIDVEPDYLVVIKYQSQDVFIKYPDVSTVMASSVGVIVK